MKVLFDQGVPVPLRRELAGPEVLTAYQMGWSEISNGELLAAAESNGFDVLLTTDQGLRYQQNLAGRRLALVVLPTTSWGEIKPHAAEVQMALAQSRPGDYRELAW